MSIVSWIKTLQLPQPVFAGLPVCPYAHRSIVTVVACECFDDAARLASWLTLPKDSIAVIEIRDGKIGVIDELNEKLSERDLVALVSDASDPMIIDGYRTTQMSGVFLILQGKAELETARRQLSRTNYYRAWTPQCRRKVGLKPCSTGRTGDGIW